MSLQEKLHEFQWGCLCLALGMILFVGVMQVLPNKPESTEIAYNGEMK